VFSAYWTTVCKTIRPMPSDHCLSCLACLSAVWGNCGQTVGWIKMKLGTEVGLGPGHIVLDGDPAPHLPKKGHSSAHFLAHVYCGQTAGWIKVLLGTEVGLGPGHIVSNGDPAPPRQRRGRRFSTHLCYGQMAEWIKMPIGTEAGLGQGHILCQIPSRRLPPPFAPPQKKGHNSQISAHVCCGPIAGWIKMPIGTEVGLDPGDTVLDGGPRSP